jgi:hypothetical protein
MSPATFSTNWALATSPQQGASRPADAVFEHVRAIGVRVYCNGACSGTVEVDALRIRAGDP